MSPGQSNYRPEALVNTRNVVHWSPALRCTPAGGSVVRIIAYCILYSTHTIDTARAQLLNTVSPNVRQRQKDFTPPTIQLCSHLFLLCHQKTIFWRLLLLTTHLSSSNFTGGDNQVLRKCFYRGGDDTNKL